MAWLEVVTLLVTFSWANAQQIYIDTTGPPPRSQCFATSYVPPTFTFRNFSFTLSETVRTATPVPPSTVTPTYASPSTDLLSLLTSISYTTWGSWDPNATATADSSSNPYGSLAWTQLWQDANPPNFTEVGLYSTTVTPTPVPSSELVLPPPDRLAPSDCYSFPKNFMFGVSGSASQIEGATAEEGKGPSLMDILVQDDRPKDYVTNENYYLYMQDIERLAAMGVRYYSFSIAWTRILPFGTGPVNQQGLDHYSHLIDFVISKGMVPVVTLLHFDTPTVFYAANMSAAADPPLIGYVNGGYQNETFVDAFVNYAKIVMVHYASRVPIFFTFNEPLLYSYNGVSVDHVIKAHAQVAHFYREKLNGTGQISIKFNDNFGIPQNVSNEADVYAASHFNSFQLATFCNPIFLGTDYPDSFKETVPDYVPLTAEDLEYIGGTADFLGIDPYTATVITPPIAGDITSIHECASNSSNANFPYCVNQTTVNQFGWNIGYRSESYVYITPTYLREYLGYLYNTFRSPVVVTEFGFPVFHEADKADLSDQLFDTPRSVYYLSYMSEILKAIWEDSVDVRGAFAWSFADNWYVSSPKSWSNVA